MFKRSKTWEIFRAQIGIASLFLWRNFYMNSLDILHSPSSAYTGDKMIHLVDGGHFPVGYNKDK